MSTFLPSIYVPANLAASDWLILAIIILSNVAFIIYSHKSKVNNVYEYMLMGRRLSLPLFVATLVATWYGGIFGVTQIAFEHGIYNFFTQGVFWYITYLIFAFYFVKRVRAFHAFTLPDLVRKMYGEKSAALAAVLIFIKTLPIVYAISLGLVLQLFFPISLFATTCIGMLIVTSYAMFGGLRTVVYSHVWQFLLMCVGVVGVFGFSIGKFGGLEFLQANLPVSYFQPCGTKSLSTTLVWMFIACSTTFINPAFYQRCAAATSDKVASRGIVIATIIWIIFDVCTTLGAMYAKAVIPTADSLTAYITYSVQLLPHGFKGIFLASILATVISSLDAFLFLAGNIVFYDWLGTEKHRLRANQAFAIGIAAFCTVGVASMFDGKIEQVWFIYKSYFAACLLLPIMLGYFFPKCRSDMLFCYSCFSSILSMIIWQITGATGITKLDPFYIGCISSISVYLWNTTFGNRIIRVVAK